MSRSDDSSSEEGTQVNATCATSQHLVTQQKLSHAESQQDRFVDDGRAGIAAFRRYFYFSEYSAFEDFEQHVLVSKLMEACAMIRKGNQTHDESHVTIALALYAEALSALQSAIQDPQQAREDATLVAAFLLCIFERLNRRSPEPLSNWRVHIGGLVHLVQIRGRDQIRTKLGRAVFRDVREIIINDALERGVQVPGFIFLWSQALVHGAAYIMRDHLAILKARLANLRSDFLTGHCSDVELKRCAKALEQDMEEWTDVARRTAEADPASRPNSRSGARAHNPTTAQDMGDPWPAMNMQVCRIMLTRIRDAISHRSNRGQPSAVRHNKWGYSVHRRQTIAQVCMSAGYLGQSADSRPQKEPVTGGLALVRLLHIAATCLMEEMGTTETNELGETIVTIDEQSRLRPGNTFSQEFDYVLQKLSYIANNYGDRYAAEVLSVLDRHSIRYNITRLQVVSSAIQLEC